MSKERLEEIKNEKAYLEGTNELMIAIPTKDYEWLIKQAERVQELEEKFEERENELIRILTNRYKYITQLENTEIILSEKIKRYRDQLKLIRKDTYATEESKKYVSIKHLIRKRVDKALEGEE